MSGVYLTDEELDRLGDPDIALPHAAELLYIRVLRRWMNYADGVVGRARKVSYQQIKEELDRVPSRGRMSNRVSLSRDQIKRLLIRLEDVGLIVSLHSKRYMESMVFRLPLAACDLVRPLDKRHFCATEETPWANLETTRAEGGNTATLPPQELRHTSELPSNSLSTPTARENFRIGSEWDVQDGQEFESKLLMLGIDPKQIRGQQKHALLDEFVSYWSGQDREGSQEFWENRFAQSVLFAVSKGLPV